MRWPFKLSAMQSFLRAQDQKLHGHVRDRIDSLIEHEHVDHVRVHVLHHHQDEVRGRIDFCGLHDREVPVHGARRGHDFVTDLPPSMGPTITELSEKASKLSSFVDAS